MGLPLSPLAGPRVAEFRGYPLPTVLPSCLAWFNADGDFEPVDAETYNPDMSHADWTRTGITSVVGGQSDPDGGSNAYIITENTGTSEHFVDEASPGADTNLIDATVWLKAGTSTEGRLNVGTLSGSSQGAIITALNSTPVITVTGSARVYHVGTNGSWHKFRVFAEVDTQRMRVQLTLAGVASYTGTSRTLYAYAPAGSYRARLVQDADGISPDVNSWGKANCTVTIGQGDPFGGSNAFLLTESVDASPVSHRAEDTSPNAYDGRTTVWEPWLKPGTRFRVELLLGLLGGAGVTAVLDLTSGIVTSTTGGASCVRIADGPDGWKQYRITGITDSIIRARATIVSNAGSGTYQADGSGNLYIYTPLGSYQQKRVRRWQGVGSSARKSLKSYRLREGGATSSRIDVGNVAELSFGIAEPFTLSCWFKTTSSTFSTLMSKAAGSGNFEGYMLSVSATGQVFFRLEGTAALNNKIEGSTTATFRDNAWHHVAFTYSGNGLLSGCTVYVDGVARSLTSTTDAFTNALTNAISFQIGNRDANSSFDGLIDEAAVYDKALSAGEVTTIYNRVVPPDLLTVGPTANLVGYWPLGDGESGSAIDHSASGNDGTFVDLTVAALRDDAPGPVLRAEQATDANRPILRASLNNRLAFSFDGANDLLTADAFAAAHAWGGGAPWTLLLLVQWPEIVVATQFCFGFASATTNARRSIGVSATGANSVLLSSNNGTTTVSQTRAILNTDIAVLGVTDDGSGNWQFWLNGTANGAVWAHGHNNVMDRCTLGAQRYNATPIVEGLAKCHVREVAGFSSVLAANEIKLLSAGMRVRGVLAP